jgi:hypothetical protein
MAPDVQLQAESSIKFILIDVRLQQDDPPIGRQRVENDVQPVAAVMRVGATDPCPDRLAGIGMRLAVYAIKTGSLVILGGASRGQRRHPTDWPHQVMTRRSNLDKQMRQRHAPNRQNKNPKASAVWLLPRRR